MTLPIKLNISAESLKEEVKCDFLVSNKLKKIQVIQVDLLNELLRVCRKHDIKLTVFAGTMLGAIRHKGFIPWDDDIDIAMTRENFERLQSIAKQKKSFVVSGLSRNIPEKPDTFKYRSSALITIPDGLRKPSVLSVAAAEN